MADLQATLDRVLDDPQHGWSVGTFGAIGEFVRDPGEPADRRAEGGRREVVTDRGGIRIALAGEVTPVAYDTLSSDGETWGNTLALCLPADGGEPAPSVVTSLGEDRDALRPQDRDARLFDLGVGQGRVRMCVRTRDPALIAALEALEGQSMSSPEAGEARMLVLTVGPNRVMLSPVARLEVYAPIPMPGGESPMGPHTHLLPKLLAARRTHAANAPIPEGLQPVLTVHPRSPWRDEMGKRTPFDDALDRGFKGLLADYGLPEDARVRADVESALQRGGSPEAFPWPETRRGRTVGRITLRRWAQAHGEASVAPWRAAFDRRPDEEEPDLEAAQHA